MPTIRFSYAGQKFKTEVPEGFRDLPEETQRNRILTSLNAKYGDKPAPAKEDKNILDYIALIERPSQAIKVGLKESTIGGALYRSLGGVDLTPSEGFLTGFGKGWMGKDEIRTQDALPDDMNPILKGVLGFAGDVATDPLTYFGPAAVRATGAGIKKASDVTGATPMLQKAGEAVLVLILVLWFSTKILSVAFTSVNVILKEVGPASVQSVPLDVPESAVYLTNLCKTVPGAALLKDPASILNAVPEPDNDTPFDKLRVPILPPYTITQVPSSVIVEPRVTGPALSALILAEI